MIKPNLEDDLVSEESGSMTSMIDVIFTLIAFMMLMINAPLLTMDMDLPDAKKTSIVKAVEKESVTLAVLQQENQWRLDDGSIVDSQTIKQQLSDLNQANDGQLHVLITTDRTTYVQRMVDTISILNELNIQDSQIAINQVKTQKL